jgi:dihydroxy-acid dehydratase
MTATRSGDKIDHDDDLAMRNGRRLRSAAWTGGHDVSGAVHRASLRVLGISRDTLTGRPIIGICNSWSELVNCNLHFRALSEAVKRGVLQAGGLPVEFPSIALGENLMKPTTMLYRNLMAMDVEESIRAYPLDGVVLLGGCDKTVPAQLMGAASVDLPTIMITGGPAQPAVFRGRNIGSATDLWHYTDEYRAGRMSEEEFAELESTLYPTVGHCTEMGTAMTMTSLTEALGMALPSTATIPAVEARRYAAAEISGRRAVELVHENLRPSHILTKDAFDNAITVLMALGGSTNAVIHLIALAGRVGVDLKLERFDEISRRTPVLANIRPSGQYFAQELNRAGGIPALMKEVESLLCGDVLTVSGRTITQNIADACVSDYSTIAPFDTPLQSEGAIAVLFGSLAPDGALFKQSAASNALHCHCGPAVVFNDIYDLAKRIDDPELDVDPDSVLVLKNSGPKGAPGMPEWGQLPIPQKLLRRGVSDMVRISDARMSGTAFGTTILHVSPESAAGGPLGAVRDGDRIVLDVPARRIDLDISREELNRRLDTTPVPPPKYRRGYGALYLDHVLQANEGCDFNFLRKRDGEPADTEPLGLLDGWIGGW